jgi:hypothetical protein
VQDQVTPLGVGKLGYEAQLAWVTALGEASLGYGEQLLVVTHGDDL